jgi:cell division protein FtsA
MGKQVNRNLVVALDIGTSKVVVLVGEMTMDGQLEIIGHGCAASHGLKKGVVVNIDATVQSIQKALEEAELMAGCQIYSAFTGVAGNHIRSLNSHGIVGIRNREVSQQDIDRVIDAAKAVAVPADQQILHVLPQEFLIDTQEGIKDPIGMTGVRLESRVHMVTSSVSAIQNLIKCVQRCGLVVSEVILEQLASSYAVLSDDEKDLGVCLIDIGGGTTDIAVFIDGAIRHTAVIPIAGDQVTNDIAVALRTPTQTAEAIKIQYGNALSESIENTMIDIPALGERSSREISRLMLSNVMEARYDELFSLVKSELRRSGFDELICSGIVLTGGASKVEGAIPLAERVFNLPVRLGLPQGLLGNPEILNNPIYATAVGLLIYGQKQSDYGRADTALKANIKTVVTRMKSWFQGNF